MNVNEYSSYTLFFSLILIAFGENAEDFPVLTESQWTAFYTLSHKQAIVGLVFKGIEMLADIKGRRETSF